MPIKVQLINEDGSVTELTYKHCPSYAMSKHLAGKVHSVDYVEISGQEKTTIQDLFHYLPMPKTMTYSMPIKYYGDMARFVVGNMVTEPVVNRQ